MPENPELSAMFTDPMILTGLLAICGAIVTRLAFRDHPRKRLVGQVLFFLALTLLLLYQGIVPYEAGPPDVSILQRIFVGLAKVVWWINAAWALIAFVRVFLIFERQPREGRLIQDLVVGMIYLGMVLSVVAYVFSVPVGTLIATSGVFAIILGLALQSTLNDVFSGIALNLGRPYAIGDWIVVSDGIEGRVVETNWRATHLLNSANDLVILPNSGLAKATLTNMSSPERSHGGKLTVRFVPTMTPAAICDVMRDVLLSCTSILAVPPPSVQIKALDAHAVEIELSFRVKDISAVSAAQNEIFDLVYRHAKAAGLKLAAAADAPADAAMPAQPGEKALQHRSTPLRLLDAIALFASLTEDERQALAGTMTRRTYRKDEIIVRQGEILHALMVVRTGVLDVTRQQHEREIELNRLAPGDCFGEGGLLTGASEVGTISALTFVVVYEIAQEGLAPIMRDRPAIAEELGLTLSRRADAERHLFEPRAATDSAGSVQSLATKIRHLFELPHVE